MNCRAWTCSSSTKAYVSVYGVTFYDPNYQYVKLISINCVWEVTLLFNEKLYYYKKRLSSCIETKMWKRNFFKKAASGSELIKLLYYFSGSCSIFSFLSFKKIFSFYFLQLCWDKFTNLWFRNKIILLLKCTQNDLMYTYFLKCLPQSS